MSDYQILNYIYYYYIQRSCILCEDMKNPLKIYFLKSFSKNLVQLIKVTITS